MRALHRMIRAMLFVAIATSVVGVRAAYATERNRAIIAAFSHRFYDLRDVRGAFERYVGPGYIQHNPNISDGRDAAIVAPKPAFEPPGSVFEVKRIVVDGDLAVIHLRGGSGAIGAGGAVANI